MFYLILVLYYIVIVMFCYVMLRFYLARCLSLSLSLSLSASLGSSWSDTLPRRRPKSCNGWHLPWRPWRLRHCRGWGPIARS